MDKDNWNENENIEFRNQEKDILKGVSESDEKLMEIRFDPSHADTEPQPWDVGALETETAETYIAPRPVSDTHNEIKFEVLKKQTPPNKGGFLKTAAVVLMAVVLGAASLGFGLGMGLKTSGKFGSKIVSPKFKFEETTTDMETPKVQYVSSSLSIADMIKEVQDSVVNISISGETTFFSRTFETEEAGSGVIFKEDDEKVYIVTNNHVVSGSSQITSVYVSIKDDERVPASLVGKNQKADLAVISILKSDMAEAGINDFVIASFGDSDLIEVGEQVVAIGNALGQGKTVTSGIISVKNKKLNIENTVLDVVQTDAAINPGNSGGALVNSKGEVIGINTAKLASNTIEGTGFAITSNVAKDIIDTIMEQQDVNRPYLGVTGFTITEEFKNMYNINKNGFYVDAVSKNSTASNAGIRPSDIIIGINGTATENYEQLTDELLKNKIGDRVSIDIIRNGVQEMTLQAELIPLTNNF